MASFLRNSLLANLQMTEQHLVLPPTLGGYRSNKEQQTLLNATTVACDVFEGLHARDECSADDYNRTPFDDLSHMLLELELQPLIVKMDT